VLSNPESPMAQKITLATVKRFIKQHGAALQISTHSRFDGMTDGISNCADRSFHPVKAPEFQGKPFRAAPGQPDHYLGIAGAWFVFQSRDYFSAYNEGGMVGIQVSNCCGRFVLAVTHAELRSNWRAQLGATAEEALAQIAELATHPAKQPRIEPPAAPQFKVAIVDADKAGLINGPFWVVVLKDGKVCASTTGIQGPTGAAGVARNYCDAYRAVMA
jgi:hypothetical protein